MTEKSSPAGKSANPPTVASLLAAEQVKCKLTDEEIGMAIGYENGNVIAQIKKGTMRLPVSKVASLAQALGMDAVLVLRALLHEQSPDLLKTLEDILEPLQFTKPERRMIKHLREVCGDTNVKPLVFDGHYVVALVTSEVR